MSKEKYLKQLFPLTATEAAMLEGGDEQSILDLVNLPLK